MKKTIISLVFLAWGVGALAQNLNPTVEVTNTYQREASGIEKPSQLMEMPDSVQHFNLDFDYSVRSTPYQGAYEFKPYLVQLRPMPQPSSESMLLLRAGAGYTMHPEATVVWTPFRKDRFRLNVYADHQSYMGYYRNIHPDKDGYFLADGLRPDGGADMRSVAGLDGLFSWSGGSVSANLYYRNIYATSIYNGDFSNNSVHFQARLSGNTDWPFQYNAGTRISYLGVENLGEFHTVTDALLGTSFGDHHIRLGLGYETIASREEYAGDISVSPHYLLTLGGFIMDLGVKCSFMYHSVPEYYGSKSDFIFPDVHVSYELIPDRLVLQAAATGGDHLNVYTDMLETNHFLCGFAGVLDNSVERINAMLGVRGNIAARFRYDLRLGYSMWKNGLLWGYASGAPIMGYVDLFNQFYTDLSLGYESEYLTVDSDMRLRFTDIDHQEYESLFSPAVFSGNLKALYNWGGRIKAGVSVEAQTDRWSRYETLPGYADLGLYGALQMTRSLGFWLRVGNLLNQTVQRVPLYAERGIYFTLGATWNL